MADHQIQTCVFCASINITLSELRNSKIKFRSKKVFVFAVGRNRTYAPSTRLGHFMGFQMVLRLNPDEEFCRVCCQDFGPEMLYPPWLH